MKKTGFIILLLFLAADLAGAGDGLMRVLASRFRSQHLPRCLNFYVARFSRHPVNTFYVGPVEIEHGRLVRALVYWKEERTLLPYSELPDDLASGSEIFAWHGHDLKLDRDTVDTSDDIMGSTYLVTHRVWLDWMQECLANGWRYHVSLAEALRKFPKSPESEKGARETDGPGQSGGPGSVSGR